jgi:hypothetical protein
MGRMAPPMSAEGAIPLGGGAVASGSIRRGSRRALLDCGKLLKPGWLSAPFWQVDWGITGFRWLRGRGSYLLSETEKPRGSEVFLFLLYKFRIAGLGNKTANSFSVEVVSYEGLLLWVSGEKLTGKKARAPGTGHRASGTGHLAPGTGHLAPGTGYRAPSTPGAGYREAAVETGLRIQ